MHANMTKIIDAYMLLTKTGVEKSVLQIHSLFFLVLNRIKINFWAGLNITFEKG